MAELGSEELFWERVLSLSRSGEENILAFYDHRLGAIFTNPRLMLIPLDDHLIHQENKIFEALRSKDGAIYQLDEHLDRLQRSAQAIGLEPPVTKVELDKLIRQVCLAGQADAGNVMVLVGRGPGGFALDIRECSAPSLYIVARRSAPRPEDFWAAGVSTVRTRIPAKQGWMSRIKSVNYLPC